MNFIPSFSRNKSRKKYLTEPDQPSFQESLKEHPQQQNLSKISPNQFKPQLNAILTSIDIGDIYIPKKKPPNKNRHHLFTPILHESLHYHTINQSPEEESNYEYIEKKRTQRISDTYGLAPQRKANSQMKNSLFKHRSTQYHNSKIDAKRLSLYPKQKLSNANKISPKEINTQGKYTLETLQINKKRAKKLESIQMYVPKFRRTYLSHILDKKSN